MINEDIFVVIMDENECNYVGPYKYYIKRHIESINLKKILECEHCGAIYNKGKK